MRPGAIDDTTEVSGDIASSKIYLTGRAPILFDFERTRELQKMFDELPVFFSFGLFTAGIDRYDPCHRLAMPRDGDGLASFSGLEQFCELCLGLAGLHLFHGALHCNYM